MPWGHLPRYILYTNKHVKTPNKNSVTLEYVQQISTSVPVSCGMSASSEGFYTKPYGKLLHPETSESAHIQRQVSG